MRKRITGKNIETFKLAKREPGSKHQAQYFIRDTKLDHFGLKVTEKALYFIWEATVQVGDKPKLKRVVLGEYPKLTLDAAKTLAETYNDELKVGHNPLA